MRPAAMKDFRRSIAANSSEFLDIVAQVEAATGQTVRAVEYARPEKCENPDLERFFRWKEQIGCVVDEPFSEATFGPELAKRVADFLEPLIPVYEYFCKFRTE